MPSDLPVDELHVVLQIVQVWEDVHFGQFLAEAVTCLSPGARAPLEKCPLSTATEGLETLGEEGVLTLTPLSPALSCLPRGAPSCYRIVTDGYVPVTNS